MANAGPTALPPPPGPPALPPPPPPRRPLLIGGAVGLVIGVLATLGVVALTGDDDSPTGVVSTDGTASTPSRPAGTEAPTEASPPTTNDPLPDPTYTTMDSVLYPGDVAALREMLDRFDFPTWWWMPDAVAPKGDPFSTVQSLVSEDTLLDDGVTIAGASNRSTTWYLATTDLAAVEATIVASVPTEIFDVETGKATPTREETSGRSSVTYLFYAPGTIVNHLYVRIEQVGPYETTTADGIDVNISWNTQADRAPSPVPTGPADERQFLASAPAAGFMRWHGTEFSVTSLRGVGASGSYSAWFKAPGDEFDKTIAFLTNSENFPGQLKLVQPGEFSTPEFWEQPMAWGDFVGSYHISKPATGLSNDLLFSLEFRLT